MRPSRCRVRQKVVPITARVSLLHGVQSTEGSIDLRAIANLRRLCHRLARDATLRRRTGGEPHFHPSWCTVGACGLLLRSQASYRLPNALNRSQGNDTPKGRNPMGCQVVATADVTSVFRPLKPLRQICRPLPYHLAMPPRTLWPLRIADRCRFRSRRLRERPDGRLDQPRSKPVPGQYRPAGLAQPFQ